MIDPTRKIIFVHPEKSGGTSVERAFGAKIIKSNDLDGLKEIKEGITDKPWLYWAEQVATKSTLINSYVPADEIDEWKTIGIVRNPLSRMLSRHRYFLMRDQPLYRAAAASNMINEYGIWVNLLKEDIMFKANGSFGDQNQQWFKFGGGPEQLDATLHLETIESDWKHMIKSLDLKGLPKEFPVKNANPVDAPHILHYITDIATRVRIALLFEKDLRLFNYGIGIVSKQEQDAILNYSRNKINMQSDEVEEMRKAYPTKADIDSGRVTTIVGEPARSNQSSMLSLHIDKWNKI